MSDWYRKRVNPSKNDSGEIGWKTHFSNRNHINAKFNKLNRNRDAEKCKINGGYDFDRNYKSYRPKKKQKTSDKKTRSDSSTYFHFSHNHHTYERNEMNIHSTDDNSKYEFSLQHETCTSSATTVVSERSQYDEDDDYRTVIDLMSLSSDDSNETHVDIGKDDVAKNPIDTVFVNTTLEDILSEKRNIYLDGDNYSNKIVDLTTISVSKELHNVDLASLKKTRRREKERNKRSIGTKSRRIDNDNTKDRTKKSNKARNDVEEMHDIESSTSIAFAAATAAIAAAKIASEAASTAAAASARARALSDVSVLASSTTTATTFQQQIVTIYSSSTTVRSKKKRQTNDSSTNDIKTKAAYSADAAKAAAMAASNSACSAAAACARARAASEESIRSSSMTSKSSVSSVCTDTKEVTIVLSSTLSKRNMTISSKQLNANQKAVSKRSRTFNDGSDTKIVEIVDEASETTTSMGIDIVFEKKPAEVNLSSIPKEAEQPLAVTEFVVCNDSTDIQEVNKMSIVSPFNTKLSDRFLVPAVGLCRTDIIRNSDACISPSKNDEIDKLCISYLDLKRSMPIVPFSPSVTCNVRHNNDSTIISPRQFESSILQRNIFPNSSLQQGAHQTDSTSKDRLDNINNELASENVFASPTIVGQTEKSFLVPQNVSVPIERNFKNKNNRWCDSSVSHPLKERYQYGSEYYVSRNEHKAYWERRDSRTLQPDGASKYQSTQSGPFSQMIHEEKDFLKQYGSPTSRWGPPLENRAMVPNHSGISSNECKGMSTSTHPFRTSVTPLSLTRFQNEEVYRNTTTDACTQGARKQPTFTYDSRSTERRENNPSHPDIMANHVLPKAYGQESNTRFEENYRRENGFNSSNTKTNHHLVHTTVKKNVLSGNNTSHGSGIQLFEANSKSSLSSVAMRAEPKSIRPLSPIEEVSTLSHSSDNRCRKRTPNYATESAKHKALTHFAVANSIHESNDDMVVTATEIEDDTISSTETVMVVAAIEIEDDTSSSAETETDDEDTAITTHGSLLRCELKYTKQIGTPLKPSSGRVCTDFDDDCELKYSVGRTRAQLTKYMDRLGIKAAFGKTTISSRSNKVSHITLSSSCHYLPKNQSENLEFWLEEGIKKLVNALILDPAYFKQGNIPIFWTRPNNNSIEHRKKHGSGELCHYIGHYRCISFRKIEDQAKYIKFRFRTCQAVLEFQFHHYCERLHNRIAAIDG